jgi:hypothetical protein
MPIHDGAPGLGLTNPHDPARRTPNTTSPRPRAENPVPARSRWVLRSGGSLVMRLARARIAITITTSPANTQRHDA